VSVKRRDLVRYLEKSGFYLLREGANHLIYTHGKKVIPVKRHKQFDRIGTQSNREVANGNVLHKNAIKRKMPVFFCLS
jgi:predicted RNA binding protein YcfA (HicA-like mRNA interferase family)